jgi:SAM-dependent methyltransferase
MTSSTQEPRVSADWDVYWRGTQENAAHQDGGPQQAVLTEFWESVFDSSLAGLEQNRLLDLACGNGAVTGLATKMMPTGEHYCLDSSLSAVQELQKRYPQSTCAAADALRTPFISGSFDYVCSQFGIEYAGWEAIEEALRLLAPQGTLALVLHLHSGAIYQECGQSVRAIEAIKETNVLPLAFAAFNAGFALNAETGSVADFKAAEKNFTPAVRGLEAIMRDMGPNVATGLPQQLYRDISHMYRNMSSYDAKEVANWVEGMSKELDAYQGRMSSMVNAALDSSAVSKVIDLVTAQGVSVVRHDTLKLGASQEAFAWALVCKRNH